MTKNANGEIRRASIFIDNKNFQKIKIAAKKENTTASNYIRVLMHIWSTSTALQIEVEENIKMQRQQRR